MKKLIFLPITVITVVLVLGAYVVSITASNTSNTLDKMNEIDKLLLSTQVYLKNDTLDIINTNVWDNSMTLENGVSYDYDYIESKLPKKVRLKIDSINNSNN